MTKKILLMPDCFKGTMTAKEVAFIMERAIKDVDASYQTEKLPISDGGEGFLDFYQAFHPEVKKKRAKVKNESMENKTVEYLVEETSIIIESAKIIGLPDAKGEVMERSSYGLGELIKEVQDKYPNKEIIISVGGSSTIDMGLGTLEALGARFYDQEGKRVFPFPQNVKKIDRFDMGFLKKNDRITLLSDVNNPLYGVKGGIAVYSGQKGANQAQMKQLNQDYQKFIKASEDKKYYGAAGGLIAGLAHFLKADIRSGMDYVLDKIKFDKLLKETSYIWTGEGSIDSQSFDGKVLDQIYARATKENIPVIAFAGKIDPDTTRQENLICLPIHSDPSSYKNYKENSQANLYQACYQTMKLLSY